MAGATLETLRIEVNASAQNASSGISSMIAPLRSLAKSVGTVLPALKQLNIQLSRLSKYSTIKLPTINGNPFGQAEKSLKGMVESLDQFKYKKAVLDQFKKKTETFTPDMYGPKQLFNPATRTPYASNSMLRYSIEKYANANGGINPYHNFPGVVFPDGTIKYATDKDGRQIAPYMGGKIETPQTNTFKRVVENPVTPKDHTPPPRPVANKELVDGFWRKYGAEIKQEAEERQTNGSIRESLKDFKFNPADPMSKVYNQGQDVGKTLKDAADSAGAAKSGMSGVSQAISNTSTSANKATGSLKSLDRELKQKNSDGKKAKAGLDSATAGANAVGKAADAAHPKVSKFSKGLSAIGRMAKMMLIRTALRALMKAFSESWQAAYAFSHKMGGSFAKAVDTMRGAFASVSLTMIQTFAPILQALVPIVVVVANAINYLCTAIQWLLGLLGMTSDLLGVSVAKMDKFRKSSGGGGGGNKGQLAKFDELNVIQSTSGGGGGGGSGLSVFESVSKEISAITQLLVGEALIAVGLILAFTGHVPIGVALAAVGAAAVAKTIINDWGKLTADTKGQIAEIMVYASGAFLGLGLILALNGHIPLGIALMAVGAANLAAAAYLGNTDQIPNEIKEKLTKIMVIAGASLLAIGAILAFSGAAVPLGIGLMVAGGLALGAAAAMNWDSLSEKVKKIFGNVCDFLKKAWESVKKAVGDAWAAVTKWWETSGIGPEVRKAWTATKTFLSDLWKSVTGKVSAAWDAVVQWWQTSGIRDKVSQAWTATKIFFQGLWDGIKTTAVNAWNAVVVWWETSGIRDSISNAWSAAKTFLIGIWDAVKLGCTNAWNAVSDWWNTNVTENVKKEGVWGGVKGFFNGIFGENGIGGWVTSAWNSVKQFWEENFAEKIKEKWDGLKEFFTDLFQPLKDAAEWVKTILGLNGQTVNTTVNINTKNGGKTTATLPMAVFTAADAVKAITKPANYVVKDSKKVMNTIVNGLLGFAEGGYGIPRGDLFIANEAGAELIGSMNGKTTVANQGQIIEGIQRGVSDANAEQNALLRQQNDLLQRILEKDASVRIGASSALGRIVTQSQQMYAKQVGG